MTVPIPGRKNRCYDLVAIGGGSAGLVASLAAAGVGARVALIEADRTGGECLYTGCVPSKSLIAAAKRAHDMRTADRVGLEPVEPRVDSRRLMERIRSVIERVGERDSPAYLRAHGVEVIQGFASFTRPGRIAVDGRELRYRAAIIATGARPVDSGIAGIQPGDHLTNETVFELDELPARLAVLGDGPTAVELGQAFARLGSKVTLLAPSSGLLPNEEDEAGCLIAERLRSEGIDVHEGAIVARAEPGSNASGMLFLQTNGGESPLPYDRLLVAVGKRPYAEGLGLEQVGVALAGDGAVKVNAYLKTTGARIYAAGDVVGKLLLTHVAAYHGLVATANALFHARRRIDHSAIPWATFSDPEVARVGLTQEQARERLGEEPLVFRHDYSQSDRALAAGEMQGFAKLVADRRGRLLGATIVAASAGESIAEVARLVRDGGRVADLSKMVHAYPTFTEGPARAADQWWQMKLFTPRMRRYLRPLLAVLRSIERPRR